MGKMAGAVALQALRPSPLCLCQCRLARVPMLESKPLAVPFRAFCPRFQDLAWQSTLPGQGLPCTVSITHCANKLFLAYRISFYWKLALNNNTCFARGSWTILCWEQSSQWQLGSLWKVQFQANKDYHLGDNMLWQCVAKVAKMLISAKLQKKVESKTVCLPWLWYEELRYLFSFFPPLLTHSI